MHSVSRSIPIYDATEHPMFVSDPVKDYFDPRDQPVKRPAPPDSVQRARLHQRTQRAHILEHLYHEDPALFDQAFTQFYRDDPPIAEELRGRAYARGALLLHACRKAFERQS